MVGSLRHSQAQSQCPHESAGGTCGLTRTDHDLKPDLVFTLRVTG